MNLNLYFAWAAWITLCVIMLSRPLLNIFKLKFLAPVVGKRKYLGWITGLAVVLHVMVYTVTFNQPLGFFLDPKYWDLGRAMGWGILALVIMIPLVLTSNTAAMKLLKKNWKRVQRLAYAFFIVAGIHIYMMGGKWLFTLLPMGIWAAAWITAYIMKKRSVSSAVRAQSEKQSSAKNDD